MQKLFLAGSGPLPDEDNLQNQTAFGLRTWQFLSAVENFDGKIRVVLIDDGGYYKKPPVFGKIRKRIVFGKVIELLHLDKKSADFFTQFENAYDSFNPTVCAGINLMPAFYLNQCHPDIPFWADLNGWSLAEAQSQAHVYQDDAYIPVIWAREKQILQIADRISTVSFAQKFCTMGQLGSIGRLNFRTEGYEFVSVVKNANETKKLTRKKSKFDLREKVPEKAFVVFFSGAYNTWLDWETLFQGLEKAMEKNPRIFFVSTGGGVKGLSNKIFEQFNARINASKHKDKFLFLGWLEKEDLLSCYEQVDIAINLDRKNTETKFGARNRINEWLMYEVPILSTVGTEITQELAVEKLLIPVKLQDPKNLTTQILSAMKADLADMTTRAKTFAEHEYSYAATMGDFSDFLKKPSMAPDHGYQLSMIPNPLHRILFRIRNEGVGVLWNYVLKKIGLKK